MRKAKFGNKSSSTTATPKDLLAKARSKNSFNRKKETI